MKRKTFIIRRIAPVLVMVALATTVSTPNVQARQDFRRLPVRQYVDKMKAGWIGQMVGVSWGYPTEIKFCGKIIPAGKVPQWRPKMVNNAFGQDDLYVEMTFLHTLEVYGLNSSIRQVGVDFANTLGELMDKTWIGPRSQKDDGVYTGR